MLVPKFIFTFASEIKVCRRENPPEQHILDMNLRKLLIAAFVLVSFNNNVCAYSEDTDRLLEGSLICSSVPASADNVFDDDPSTSYSAMSSSFEWVGLDLGEPHVITRIEYMPTSTTQGPDRVLLGLFEGANSPDFMDAMPLYLISEKPDKGVFTGTDINVSRGFRYVRYVGASGSFCSVAELKFYGHAGEGDDSQFYQITNLPTLSIHVQDNAMPVNRGEDFESQSVLIYDEGKMLQEYPILFRVRGNYSATHENKAFRMKYNDGKSHHVMKGGKNESPVKAKKWVLINSYRDKTLMRNPVAWAMSKRAEMKWTPWSQVVDLVINGEYRGTYTLADHVDVHSGRIDITEMTETDIDDESITGGYYVELDNNAYREPINFTSYYGNPISVHDPDDDVIQPEQFRYIQNVWNNMESVVFGSNYKDPEKGTRSVLDIETFLRHFLTSEFNGNTDMICQVFFYKERGDDHFYVGPVWDADLALENDANTYPANERMDWTYKVRDTGDWRSFVSRVLSDPSVYTKLREMWAKLRRKGSFDPKAVAADVDSLRQEISASARLNFIRWPYLTQWLDLNPAVPGTWDAEVNRVRNFVYNRVEWMDKMLSYGVLQQQNGVYQINTTFDLCEFAELVNNGETAANAVLNADLDMEDFSSDFTPIGTDKKPYTGIFNGNGHTISHLNITGKNYVGLFGMVGPGAEIRDLNLDATCSVSGENYVGGFIGYVRSGKVTVSKCGTAAAVTATGGYAAGIIGHNRLLGNVVIQESYNLGRIQADSMAAAMVAPSKGKVFLTDSYNAGKVSGAVQGQEFACTENTLSMKNCYDAYSRQVEHVTPVDVRSGALCYLLNTGIGENKWYQNIDNGLKADGHPVQTNSSGIVYNIDGVYTNINGTISGYRYYKWEVLGINNGSIIQFGEFEILDEEASDYSGMVIYKGTESSISNRNWPHAGDNDETTKYCSSFNGYAYFLFDAQETVIPFGYRIYTANDTKIYSGRNPNTWRLYGSNIYSNDPNDDCWILLGEKINDTTLGATNYTPYDFLLPTEDKQTGIDERPIPDTSRNGAEVYDLSGRRINSQSSILNSQLKKGVYIVNGKKVLLGK